MTLIPHNHNVFANPIEANTAMIQEVNVSVKNLCDAQVSTTSTLRALIAFNEGHKRDVKVLKDENKTLKKKIRDLEKKYVEMMKIIAEHRLSD